MEVLRTSKSRRNRLAAVKCLAQLDKINLQEVQTLIAAKRVNSGEFKPQTIYNTQINLQAASREELEAIDATLQRLTADGSGGSDGAPVAHPEASR